MAPPGVLTFYDQVDLMTISGHRSSALLQSPFSSLPSFGKQPHTSVELPLSSTPSSLSAVCADHNYVLRPVMDTPDQRSDRIITAGDKNVFPIDENNNDKANDDTDKILGSCGNDVDYSASGDICDMDFLQDLDDLDFDLDDLDPCGDTGIEDSFQDFIDSALDEPCMSYPDTEPSSEHGHDAVILREEDFMGMIGLKPVARNPLTGGLNQSQQSTSCSNAYFPTLSSPLSCDTPSIEGVPTKLCLCSGYENFYRALYSMAHSTDKEDVQVCSSTMNTRKTKTDTESACDNCSPCCASSDLTSPLYVDTSFQPLTDEYLDILMSADLSQADAGKRTAKVFSWLGDNQNQQPHNKGSEHVMSDCGLSTSPDLESFVSLEDLVMNTDSLKDELINSPTPSHDHTYKKTQDLSDIGNDEPSVSQLKLSFVTGAFDHTRHKDITRDHSNLNHKCLLSPSPVVGKELFSAMSPLPNMDDSSPKNSLALLTMFSDENAVSLLHADPVVPNIRFM